MGMGFFYRASNRTVRSVRLFRRCSVRPALFNRNTININDPKMGIKHRVFFEAMMHDGSRIQSVGEAWLCFYLIGSSNILLRSHL